MAKAAQILGHFPPSAAHATSMEASESQPCSHLKDLSAESIIGMLCQEMVRMLPMVQHLGRPCCISPLVAFPDTKRSIYATFQHVLSIW